MKNFFKSVGVKSATIGAIALIIVAGMNILNSRSKLYRDNQSHQKTITNLKDQISEKNNKIQHLETQLTPFKTIALEKYAGTEQERLKKLSERILELENPLKKSIASATAIVEITIKSDEEVSTRYMDKGGLLSFVKDRQHLLVTANTYCDAKQNGKGEVTYKGTFHIQESASPSIGKPIEILRTADIIQIYFPKIPESSEVISGKASVTVNGNARFEFKVQPQKMRGKNIIIKDIKNGFLTTPSTGLEPPPSASFPAGEVGC